ncbi:hypothetical protein [Streptomyces sp. AC1-42T]|uniref:hypothetical protein n=1 Tax=Streptomyces sp. AC1-42T TaxID=2218665 RepID=UPI000DABA63A|nr:hypothetical protein [Streptomyces sp. AC1-42T]PZT71410.1 hypothetical protein DNK55_32370 [Streptomyces sp. AC1-42T]
MSAATEQTAIAVPRGGRGTRGVGPVPTEQLRQMLRDHFIKPGEELPGAVFLTEVTAPGRSTRRADAVHIGTWASRGGGEIDVCEIKTQRSDWLREVRDPGKAEAWWPYSTRFWLVVPSTAVAAPDELPPGWGLMVPKRAGRRFQVVVEPAVRTPEITPELLVTLLTCTETVRANALRKQRDLLGRQHREQVRKIRQEAGPALDPDVQERLRLLDALETALGGRLVRGTPWGDAVSTEQAAEMLAVFARPQLEQERAHRRAVRLVEALSRHEGELAAALKLLRDGLGVAETP